MGEFESFRDDLITKLCPTLATPWTAAYWAHPSMEFCRQEHWSGLLFPPPGDLPDPGIEPRSPALQADSLLTELQGNPFERTDSNIERSSALGKMLSNSTACYREIIHENKS